jgi:hypothetical protein
MQNNVLDHSEGVEIPGQKPNIPGHMVADAAGQKRWKMWRTLYYDYFSLMKC